MSFLASSKDITLDGSVLKASCLKNDGTTYNDSSLDLNNCLYINSGEGSFDVKTGDYFYELSKNVSLDPNTAILKASLNALDIDKGQYYFDRTFELNLYVGNNDGTLVFNIPKRSILYSVPVSSLSANGAIFSALALGIDGHYHEASVDLDNWFGNNDGVFQLGGTNFSATASNIQVYRDTQVAAVMLSATLTKADGTTANSTYMLDMPVSNYQGSFAVQL